MVAAAPNETYSGVKVADVTPGGGQGVRPVREALALLDANAPARFRRLASDVPLIVVVSSRGAAQFVPKARAIFVDPAAAETASTPLLAAALVHEATHARIHRAGIPYGSKWRERIERCCTRQEADFLRPFPNGEARTESVTRKLELRWWEEQRLRDRSIAYYRRLGIPRWVLRITHWRP